MATATLVRRARLGEFHRGETDHKVLRRNIHIFAQAIDLVLCWHIAVEDLAGQRNQPRMGDPGAVMAVARFRVPCRP